MSRNLPAASLFVLAMIFATTAFAQDATPPKPLVSGHYSENANSGKLSAKTVKAIIVKSWGDNPVWADLNTNWSTYGSIPVSIDHTTLIQSDFTYQDLVNSKAKVVIMSDAAGGTQQYSSAEIAAIRKYANKGHEVLATYATFEYATIDNRSLAPIFGLSSSLTYDTTDISGAFKKAVRGCLLKKIPGQWQSLGFNYSQIPQSGYWKGHLKKTKAQAVSDSYEGVITLYTAATYTGVYISNMPEYQNVGGDDEQLLYNAITCYAK